jgi:CspA family cold shock protein
VKWFDEGRGLGLIIQHLFVRSSAIKEEGLKTLKEGQVVEFDIVEGPEGLQAATVFTVKLPETLQSDQTSPASRVLDSLLDFIEKTRERFYNENRRYQLLARVRRILREQLFELFPADSTDRSLITSIINATNRTTAKNFRVEYLNIFQESLEALRDRRTDHENTALLERRLLEIDDEL